LDKENIHPERRNATMRLKGQVVWITGSAKRVGRAVALGCADEGADIVVHCRSSRAEGEEVVDLIRQKGRRSILVQGDHSDPESVDRMIDGITSEFGQLTALVNGASTFPQAPFETISEEDFFRSIRDNLYGPFLCAQRALPLLRQNPPGRIVNFTDSAFLRPYRKYAHYMAAKGGLHTLSLALARELAPDVMVNEIAPGPVLEPEDMTPERRAATLQKIPLARWGTPTDVVKAVVFLLESDYLCGETIYVDGGRTVG
jgi:pteridine reductase